MTDIERYLNDIMFTEAVGDVQELNDKDCYSVHQIHVSPLIKDQVTVFYDFHYGESANRIVDSLAIIIKKSSDSNVILANLNSMDEVREYYNNVRSIDKKIELYRQWQNKGFAKGMIKQGFRDLRLGIQDYIVARFRIIKLKLGGKVK